MTGLKAYLVAYTARPSDGRRLQALGLRFKAALQEAVGGEPSPLLLGEDLSFAMMAISSPHDLQTVQSAIMKRLSVSDFDFSGRTGLADRIVIAEVAGFVASDAAVRAAFGLR